MKPHHILAVRPRSAGPLLVGAIAIALSASIAACSSSPAAPAAGPTASQSPSSNSNGLSGGGPQIGSGGITVAFSQCMRSHGEPKFPDPNSQGVVSAVQAGIDPSTPQFQAAQRACGSLANGPGQSTGNQQQNTAEALKYAKCMRSHGILNFPDPGSNGEISINSSAGINPRSAQFQAAGRICTQQTGFGKGASLG